MKTTFLIFLAFFWLFQGQNCDGKKMRNTETNQTPPATAASRTPTPKADQKFERLPSGVSPEAEVVVQTRNEKGEVVSNEMTTVEKRLNELGARYEKDVLVDKKGREIRFFEQLCRGVSAGAEQDEIDRKAKERELTELEKKYTVIILFCDPRKAM